MGGKKGDFHFQGRTMRREGKSRGGVGLWWPRGNSGGGDGKERRRRGGRSYSYSFYLPPSLVNQPYCPPRPISLLSPLIPLLGHLNNPRRE